MREIDGMSDNEIQTLQLKGMLRAHRPAEWTADMLPALAKAAQAAQEGADRAKALELTRQLDKIMPKRKETGCHCRPGSPDTCPVCDAREELEWDAENFKHEE